MVKRIQFLLFQAREVAMSIITLYVVTCVALLTAWGLPFFSQEEDNEFLGLKRIPYPANWHAVTVSEQVSEYWLLLKRTSQYSMDTVRDYVSFYKNMLWQQEEHKA
ncbi:uncharacterized protein C3orf85 homolog isoform X2 [Thamnophis elegans]|uniref:uncharacterized protein C3orf85 homolog isoform X2 n=1 Tax=Thamnophis elegans TaxID=35005 RepID=UPI001378B37F|nr:uncharacterized protein C3orf85 homolog isoform X2 [Thamnophis elegans]